MKTIQEVEMVFGIYWAKEFGDYRGRDGERQASCVIKENDSDQEIIAKLVNADFLNQCGEYEVQDNICNLFVYHKINGKRGGIALALVYEEDIEPWKGWTNVEA